MVVCSLLVPLGSVLCCLELKVVLTKIHPAGAGNVMGIAMPTQYLAWAELGLMYILVPGSSFFGHLCGILTGMVYTTGVFDKLIDAGDQVLDHAFGDLLQQFDDPNNPAPRRNQRQQQQQHQRG